MNNKEKHKNVNNKYKSITDKISGIILGEYGNAMWDIDLNDCIIKVTRTTEFNNDYNSHNLYSKGEINRIISDIESGYLYEDSPGNDEDETNYIAKYSTDGYLAYEKRVPGSWTDRVGYFILKPEFSKNLNSWLIRVYLLGCIGHKFVYGGKIMYFSDNDENDIAGPSLSELEGLTDRRYGGSIDDIPKHLFIS